MKCANPNCKNENVWVIDSIPVGKIVKRRRKCICGFEFETTEKITKKRKIENRTLWFQYRFNEYITGRFVVLGMPLIYKLFKHSKYDIEKRDNSITIIYKNKNNKKLRAKIKWLPRSEIIKAIVNEKEFWDYRHKYNKNSPIDDRKLPGTVKEEINLFKKSLETYIKDEKKFNREYMYELFKDKSPLFAKAFKEDNFLWQIWRIIR